jgi:putative hemolysin
MDWTTSLLVMAASVALSGFFDGTETGFTSVRRIRLLHRARAGSRLAALAARLAADREQVILSAVVASNAMTVAGSAVATVGFRARFGEAGETLAAVLMTALTIVFGQVLPKSLYRAHPETLTTWSALPFLLATRALIPLQWLILTLSRGVLGLIGQSARGATSRLTKERILMSFELSMRGEELAELEESLVRRFVHGSQLSLAQVMTPMREVTAVRSGESVAHALELVRSTGHSRLPLLDSEDDIQGLVLFRDLIHAGAQEPVEDYARTMLFLSATMGLDEAIAALSHARASTAAVIDALDAAVGIVSLEDLLEPLLGEMADEHDPKAAA